MTDDRIDYHRNRLRGVPLTDLGRMLGEVLRDVAREAAEVERARVLQAGVPGRWADIVEQRLLTWRQRFTNRSGDQLALDDFMDQQSIDDLVDFVCDEHAAPHPPIAFPFPASYDTASDTLTINGKRYAAGLFDERGLLAPAGTVVRIEDGPDDTVTLTRLQQPPSAQADAVEALRRLVVAIIDDDGDDPGNAPGHAHSRPGIWDDDNEPAIAGKPCEKCAAWSNARAVLAAQGGKDE